MNSSNASYGCNLYADQEIERCQLPTPPGFFLITNIHPHRSNGHPDF